jgi:folate-dependent phosphoribosylglycinamide formyltransferase PurN
MTSLRVALLAGRRRSPASLLMLAALDRLRLNGVEIAAVFAVSEFRWSRLWDWYRRFGAKAVIKGLREFGFPAVGGVDEEQAVLRERLSQWSVTARSLPEFCRQRNIPFHLVPEIHGAQSLKLLSDYGCDYGVYSGAGILRQPLLDRFLRGVLNLHCGSLPAIRGMNGVEWNLFHGRTPEVTLPFIDAGIDTGRILDARHIDIAPGDRLGRLRGKTILAGIDLLKDRLLCLGDLAPRENPPQLGRQYFAMADTLKALVEDRLARRQIPRAATNPALDSMTRAA